MPSLGLGFLLVSWSPPAICRWAVGSSQHVPLWRVDSVQLALDGVNFHPAPTLGQPLHLLRGLVGVAGSWGAWSIGQTRVEKDPALSGVGEAKAALTLVGSPTAPPVVLGFRGCPGADGPEGRGLSVQPAVRSWGPLPWGPASWWPCPGASLVGPALVASLVGLALGAHTAQGPSLLCGLRVEPGSSLPTPHPPPSQAPGQLHTTARVQAVGPKRGSLELSFPLGACPGLRGHSWPRRSPERVRWVPGR